MDCGLAEFAGWWSSQVWTGGHGVPHTSYPYTCNNKNMKSIQIITWIIHSLRWLQPDIGHVCCVCAHKLPPCVYILMLGWVQVRVLSLECECQSVLQESSVSVVSVCQLRLDTVPLVCPGAHWHHTAGVPLVVPTLVLLLSIATAAWTQLCQSCHQVCCVTYQIMGIKNFILWNCWKFIKELVNYLDISFSAIKEALSRF